ncbi:MAG TPA: DUF5054 domain-containing protein [Bryobacteraceae bacterium]|nr:DUF5054 domain-containing protein [Bryobacteraceae bacterium]
MNRRRFVSHLAGAAGCVAFQSNTSFAAEDRGPQPDRDVRRVLVMFKCHLDVGFIDTQAAVIHKYFKQYFPQAIQLASTLRQSGEERYVWTTGSWLVYEYLEQASTGERKRMEQAIAAGDIAWHALPFSWQTELLTRSAISGAIGFSKSLDRRFGRNTTGAKMTDVPGHSRGLIAPLAESGVTFLDIGVNSASTPPDVPDAFVWKDPNGASIVMMYHRREYGGIVSVPQSDLAVAVEVRDDNSGPHTTEEIHKIYADLRKRFPNATLQASNLTEIANAVQPYKGALPVLTQEIGDTWIYGVASDPVKVARYRELLRLRTDWIKHRKLQVGDPVDLAFLSKFALAAEHTWGTDTKTWLDFDHYTPDALAQVLEQPHYKTVTGSWVEKRADIDDGIALLPSALRAEATAAVAKLRPTIPDMTLLQPHDAATPIATKHFLIGLDPATGEIVRLRGKAHREWASHDHPLGSFTYQTLSKHDYDRFLASYITVQTDWAPKDFGKPNIEKFGAESRIWKTKLTKCLTGEDEREHRIVLQMHIDHPSTDLPSNAAWPTQLYLELVLPKKESKIFVNLTWLGKLANRLPEAIWFSFNPIAPEAQSWLLSKVEQSVSPMDVVSGGNRHMHALSNDIRYHDGKGSFAVETLDAPLVVLGEKSPIYFSNEQPDLSKGIHFSLFNNGWGTNYVQWFGEDMRFRFVIEA